MRVLCLHGLGPSGPAVFDGLRAAARDELDLSAPPFPGWERTPSAAREDYRPSALARWAEEQVDGPFALVGFSWGGTVGLRVSPERLRALVLVDVGYQSGSGESLTYEEALAEYADVDFAPPEAFAAGVEGVGLEPASAALHNVRAVPVLLLAATVPHVERRADDLVRFAETLPTAEIHSVEGAEHNVLETAPAEAIPLIRDFLRGNA